MTTARAQATSFLIVGGIVATFLLLCALAWSFTLDDAYITWRYAKNVSDGLGPIWNPDPSSQYAVVEGYTSFLSVWVLALIAVATGATLYSIGKGLGVVSVVVLIGCVTREIRREQLGWRGTAVALSFFILPFTILHSVSGMETGLFFLVNWLCAIAAVRLAEGPTPRRAWLFVFFGLLATMTRPDFAAIFLVLAAYVFWRAPSVRASLLLAGVLLYVLPGMAMTLWRLSFYGDIVPNTFHAKQQVGLFKGGVFYVLRFGIVVCVPYLLIAARGWRSLWDSHRDLLVVAGVCIAIPGAYYTTVMPTMGLWYRFLLPQAVLLAFLAGVAIESGERPTPSFLRFAPALGVLLLVLGCLAHLPPIFQALPAQRAGELRYLELARRLRPFRAPDRWLNYYDAGAVPYTSDWNVVDVVGLNTSKDDLRHDCAMKNDVILRTLSSRPAEPRREVANPCLEEPGLYVALVDLPWMDQGSEHYRYMRVFVRHDITYADELRRSLLDGWPEPYAPRTGFFYRYTRRFRWVGASAG